ncbi:hypothetical protein SteCoe_23596 [Stentor coeruleus]|uniref:Uncharacterized protein n=1 Tax=Stentor coeruleus TaxID=5963 RepID=A0A1R2BJJ1_9CILI|nr:hypothetical protein SteCoe_23596 [Stentor coeruleus]
MNVTLSESLSEISEFKKVLKEYRGAIKQAKAQQNLKNFHQTFQENLKRKIGKSQEKLCNKISNKIKPSIFSIHSFDFYKTLYIYKNLDANIKIIPTLYINSDIQFFVRIEERIKWTIGQEAKSAFLSSLTVSYGKPICIFKPFNGKNKLFSNLCYLETFINQNINEPGLYQHFIQTIGNNTSILLVHTKENFSNKYHIIKNKLEIPQSKNPKIERNKSSTSNLHYEEKFKNIIKDHINTYEKSLTRQLTFGLVIDLKLSENNNSIKSEKNKKFKNLIERIKNPENESDKKFDLWVNEELNEKYLVNLKNSRNCVPYHMKAHMPEIEGMIKCLRNLIGKQIRKQFINELDEAELVFIKDQSLNWLFLKVKAIKCAQPQDYELANNLSFDSQSPDKISPYLNLTSYMNYATKPLFDKKPNQNKQKIKIRRIENIKANSSFQFHRNTKSMNMEHNVSNFINKAAQQCDIIRYNARVLQNPDKKMSEKYSTSTFWKDFSVKFYTIIVESDISKYYLKFNNENFHAMSRATLRIFCCDMDKMFLKKLSESHKHYSISNNDYDIFISTFIRVISEYRIDEDDLKLIHTSFESIRACIVNSN